jgi:hypothetical protein
MTRKKKTTNAAPKAAPLPGTPQPPSKGKATPAMPEQIEAFACSKELKASLIEFLENEPLALKKTGPLVAGLVQMHVVKLTVTRG